MNNRRLLLLVVFLILYSLINFLSQRQGNGMGSADAMDVMKLLAGKKMSAQDWTIMKQRLNLPDAQPTPH